MTCNFLQGVIQYGQQLHIGLETAWESSPAVQQRKRVHRMEEKKSVRNPAKEMVLEPLGKNLRSFLRWICVAVVLGLAIGLVGVLFYYALAFATNFRMENEWTLFLLPAAGLLIVFCYRVCRVEEPKGTNLVIEAVRSDVKIPARMAPLIFVSTFLTHLFGGSAGREGAALQLGGSLGNLFGKRLGADSGVRNIYIMCGMSAAFAALFGTPVASTVFSMELISVGVMYYSALLPCAISSVVASALAIRMGITPEGFALAHIPVVTVGTTLRVLALAVLCAGVSVALCWTMHTVGHLFKKYFPNQYLRVAVGGVLVAAAALLIGSRDYLGAGMQVIEAAMEGQARPEAFLLKILFTAVTLGAGFKGGEIVPSFFVGATFGCWAGGVLGLDPGFSAALGLTALFCGVTNCPVTAMVISWELFGFADPVYFLIAVAVGYMLSGYFSLYSAQKILYSKVQAKYIDRATH